jgi:hypothetical protein
MPAARLVDVRGGQRRRDAERWLDQVHALMCGPRNTVNPPGGAAGQRRKIPQFRLFFRSLSRFTQARVCGRSL